MVKGYEGSQGQDIKVEQLWVVQTNLANTCFITPENEHDNSDNS